ncbi:hypothetical protein [Actinocorallia libanotica]
MRRRNIGLAAVMAAIVGVPTAAHAGPEDAWRHVYFTPMSSLGDFEAAGPREVWQIGHKQAAIQPSLFHWTGGSTWKGHSLPDLPSILGTEATDVDVVGPDEAWVHTSVMTGINPYRWTKYLARWDGSAWTRIAMPASPIGTPSGLPDPPSVLEANAGGVWLAVNDRVSRWDGSTWTVTGTLDGTVRDLRSFSQGDALARTDGGLWKWDGTTWQKLPGGWPAKAQITGPDSAWYADTDGLHTWNGAAWNTTPYPDGRQDPAEVRSVSESDGLWIHLKLPSGLEQILRWKDGAWIDYADTPDQVQQVTVDDAGRVWAVDRIVRYTPTGSGGQAPEYKGRLLRLSPSGLGWQPLSVPEADYRLIELPGSDRLYAYGRNGWTGTRHITTNADPLP